ncbi:unnamed protein product [Rotaria socialis]
MSLRKLAVTIRNCSYIGDLSQNYKTQDALRIYSQQTIVYEGLNQALRSRKLDILLHYRGFIADMYQGIQTLRREQQHQHTDVTSTFYYRGQRMHVEELELVRQNKYLSINTFFSTSTNPEVAELFMPPLDQNVVQSVLFKLHVNTANEIQPFADIKTCSNVPDEDETLFIPGTIFLISKVTEPSNGVETHTSPKYWIIDLELCNTHPRELNTTFEYFSQSNNLSTLAKLGGFSRHIGKYDIAHRCYETLLVETGKNCIDSIFGMA